MTPRAHRLYDELVELRGGERLVSGNDPAVPEVLGQGAELVRPVNSTIPGAIDQCKKNLWPIRLPRHIAEAETYEGRCSFTTGTAGPCVLVQDHPGPCRDAELFGPWGPAL